MASKRAIKKPSRFESKPFVLKTTKIPRKIPRLPKDGMVFLVNCFEKHGDVPQDLRGDLAAEWFQGTKLTKEQMQKKISRWVWRQRNNKKYRGLELEGDDDKKQIRFSDPQKRCLVSYFEQKGDIPIELRRELAEAWSPGSEFTKKEMFAKISNWLFWRRMQKKKARQDKNEESGVKEERNKKRRIVKGCKEKNVIELDALTLGEETELLKLYKGAKTVTFEKMMEWASEMNKNVHTVLNWIMRQREKELEENMKKMEADESEPLDGCPINKESLQKSEELGQEEEDELKVLDGSLMNGPQEDEDVVCDEDMEQEESDERGEHDSQGEPEVIVIDDDDVTDLRSESEKSESNEYDEEDFLLLENDNRTQCFMNTIANLLHSCHEVLMEILNFDAYSDHALWDIISKILTQQIRSTGQWRMTLNERFHYGEQDAGEVFCALITNLNEVNELNSMAFDEKIATRCKTCGTKEKITTKLYSELSINQKDTLENFFERKYKKKEKTCKCGAKMEKDIEITTHGKYHFMVIYHDCVSFENRDANQVFDMFGSTWKIRSFAQYIEGKKKQSRRASKKGEKAKVVDKGRNGHYVAWVNTDSKWICVNDEVISETKTHLDLSEHLVNIIAFEKIEDTVKST